MNIWSNRHLTSPRDIEWHRFELHKHRSCETYSKANSHNRSRSYSGPSFFSHLRQQNRVILAYFAKNAVVMTASETVTSKRYFCPQIVRQILDCVRENRFTVVRKDRFASHVSLLAYNFSWNFSISFTCALTTFPIRAAPVILQCLCAMPRDHMQISDELCGRSSGYFNLMIYS